MAIKDDYTPEQIERMTLTAPLLVTKFRDPLPVVEDLTMVELPDGSLVTESELGRPPKDLPYTEWDTWYANRAAELIYASKHKKAFNYFKQGPDPHVFNTIEEASAHAQAVAEYEAKILSMTPAERSWLFEIMNDSSPAYQTKLDALYAWLDSLTSADRNEWFKFNSGAKLNDLMESMED
jgi:hypothetical protein